MLINTGDIESMYLINDGNMLSYSYGVLNINNILLDNIGFDLRLGIDYISYYFILLTGILYPIVILSNWSNINSKTIEAYLILMLILESVIMGSFMVQDLLSFYVLFESMLPILFVVIGIWGSSRKISASFYLFLYTLFGSYFMFLGFLSIYILTGSLNMSVLSTSYIDVVYQYIIWICIFVAILVKTPIWPFHLWLPKAHSEAPVGGSVLLAGIILKLAVYVVIRVMLPILPEATNYFVPLVYIISIISILYSSATILRQVDMKVIVAYSSIAHMGIVIMGIFSNSLSGLSGSMLLSLSHGLVSPALFILLGGVLYDRYHTRIITEYRGLSIIMPIFSILFFVFTLANMGTPLTGNFVGEFSSLYGIIQSNFVLGALASLSIVFSAGYSVYLYNRITGGILSIVNKKGENINNFYEDINRREYYVLIILLVLTILIGIYPNIVLSDLTGNLQSLIYNKSSC